MSWSDISATNKWFSGGKKRSEMMKWVGRPVLTPLRIAHIILLRDKIISIEKCSQIYQTFLQLQKFSDVASTLQLCLRLYDISSAIQKLCNDQVSRYRGTNHDYAIWQKEYHVNDQTFEHHQRKTRLLVQARFPPKSGASLSKLLDKLPPARRVCWDSFPRSRYIERGTANRP